MDGSPLWHSSECQAGGGFSRQVFEAVNGEVGPAIEHGGLHFASEHADATHRSERSIAITIAFRRNVYHFDFAAAVRISNQVSDIMGLPQGKLAGSRGNPDHSAGGITHVWSVSESQIAKVAQTFGSSRFPVPKLSASFATASGFASAETLCEFRYGFKCVGLNKFRGVV